VVILTEMGFGLGIVGTIIRVIGWAFVGLIAGWLANKVNGRSGGLINNLVVGMIGAFIGGFILDIIFDDGAGLVVSIIVAFICAMGINWLYNRRRPKMA
jgi:uncharacterized membrane protein YeaQ/YmgE (transglycosylase-associated protein family)